MLHVPSYSSFSSGSFTWLASAAFGGVRCKRRRELVNNAVIQGDGADAAIQIHLSGFNLMGGDDYSQQQFCEEGGGETSGLLQEGEQLVKKVGGVFAFNVKDGPGGETARWVVDVKSGQGSVTVDPGMWRMLLSSTGSTSTGLHLGLCF